MNPARSSILILLLTTMSALPLHAQWLGGVLGGIGVVPIRSEPTMESREPYTTLDHSNLSPGTGVAMRIGGWVSWEARSGIGLRTGVLLSGIRADQHSSTEIVSGSYHLTEERSSTISGLYMDLPLLLEARLSQRFAVQVGFINRWLVSYHIVQSGSIVDTNGMYSENVDSRNVPYKISYQTDLTLGFSYAFHERWSLWTSMDRGLRVWQVEASPVFTNGLGTLNKFTTQYAVGVSLQLFGPAAPLAK